MIKIVTVSGDSMSPSFQDKDTLIVRAITSRSNNVAMREDVVLLRDPSTPGKFYFKRVVGMPSEEILIFEGMLYINGKHLFEPYLFGLPPALGMECKRWNLEENTYFVMGDQRAHSTDSRSFGPIDASLILGKAWFRIWPLERCGFL